LSAAAETRWRRADSSRLRAAVLDGDALMPLIEADPERAAVLLKAAVFEPLGRRRMGSLIDRRRLLEITNAPQWFTPLPERGPFLGFLLAESEVALRCIVEVVEHATERWEAAHNVHPDDMRFELLLNGAPVTLVGDAQVLHWHRGEGRVPSVLASALMALESYMYRRLDDGDDIGFALDALLASRSAAALGVLAEVACYKPELLRDKLAPLVSSAALLVADRGYRLIPHMHLMMAGLTDQGFEARIQEWNTMPHRATPLTQHVMRFVLPGVALVEEMAAARAWWAESGDGRWNHLIAQMDPANHVASPYGNGGTIWEYEAPEELQPEIAESSMQLTENQFWIQLPYKIREWIDNRVEPPADELQAFWDDAQGRLAEPASESVFSGNIRSRADLECALGALYVVCGRAWLQAHPDHEAWCRAALLAPFEAPPEPHAMDFAGESSDERWDMFCAEAIPVLWAEEPDDPELRAAVARLATNRHYNTVERTFARVAALPELGSELHRLERLAFHWARFAAWSRERRDRLEYAKYEIDDSPLADELPDLETPTREAIDAFVTGTLEDTIPSLVHWVEATPAGKTRRRDDARWRLASAIDLNYLLRAMAHRIGPEADPGGQASLGLAADLAKLLAGSLVVNPGEHKVDGTPYEHERVALDLVARVVVAADPREAAPIWEPILALGAPAHYWVTDFLREIWAGARHQDPVPRTFPDLVKEMIAFAAECETWRKPHRSDDNDLALAGLDSWGHGRFEARHAALVASLQPEWGAWVRGRMANIWFARRVVNVFAEPGAGPVADDGLRWLAEREQKAPGDRDLDTAIAEMLAKLFAASPDRFRAGDAIGRDARALLTAIAGRGSPLALELLSRLA
jgi:hypothetical protein